MGIYDKVRLEKAFPELALAEGTIFNTKSLHAGFGEFTITDSGKLVEHLYRCEPDPENPICIFAKRIPIRDQVIEYHGDLLLSGPDTEDCWIDFVARFTHGALEWIRPVADYPEANRELLGEQGAR